MYLSQIRSLILRKELRYENEHEPENKNSDITSISNDGD